MNNLPPGFEQIELFPLDSKTLDQKKVPPRRKKGTFYRCTCGKSVGMIVSPLVVVCACGRIMKQGGIENEKR